MNSVATSLTEEESLVLWLEADGQSTFQCLVYLQNGHGPGGSCGFR